MEHSEIVLENIFQITRQVRAGNLSLANGKMALLQNHGLNRNSAAITIRSLCHMLNGERYRRAMTIASTDYYLQRINDEDGSPGLLAALTALESHIDYRNSLGVSVPGLQCVLAKYSSSLNSH